MMSWKRLTFAVVGAAALLIVGLTPTSAKQTGGTGVGITGRIGTTVTGITGRILRLRRLCSEARTTRFNTITCAAGLVRLRLRRPILRQ